MKEICFKFTDFFVYKIAKCINMICSGMKLYLLTFLRLYNEILQNMPFFILCEPERLNRKLFPIKLPYFKNLSHPERSKITILQIKKNIFNELI